MFVIIKFSNDLIWQRDADVEKIWGRGREGGCNSHPYTLPMNKYLFEVVMFRSAFLHTHLLQ